ncbi:MAG: T9SS type A sorting domain-containing protein, partial [Bacteroidetes bacterium]|nr:T9SS type A sorting domain-containing protein [Bacteroidota bacterium]
GASLSEINDAVSAINEGFDECRTLVSCPIPKDVASSVLKGITLSQNHPNPFNPVTRIEYGIPQDGVVRLRVYDLLGRVVTTLVDGPVSPGMHSVSFNAGRLPSGVYLYRLEAEGQVLTRRMALTR